MDEIRVALFGTSGFAANYLEAFKNPKRENVRLVAAVDPYASGCDLCPLYSDAEQMYREAKPDIAVIATPIQLHREQAEQAFGHGCDVVLEKPLAGDEADARKILAARDRAGRLLNVDYQMCYDPVIRAVKHDADRGVFGAPLNMKVIVLWPRGFTYYGRSTHWAGRRYDAEGRPVFDSVLNNATAHYLMNMLFMTGAPAQNVRCRTYRANDIETYDTAVMKAESAGAGLFIAVSHAVREDEKQEPMFEYRYEKATLRYGRRGGERRKEFTARFDDGREIVYGSVEQEYMENLWNMVDARRLGTPVLCSGETALLQTQALESMRLAQPDSEAFPASLISTDGSMNWVEGLAPALWRAFDTEKLPELGEQGLYFPE
ncbi:MAG: Gfo/Idh/MocA family oxidoreductase [Clostridiales bacterium]|nr:Gfo/Idh/MocA family oxidoreductase [Clostridiales bacterium]